MDGKGAPLYRMSLLIWLTLLSILCQAVAGAPGMLFGEKFNASNTWYRTFLTRT